MRDPDADITGDEMSDSDELDTIVDEVTSGDSAEPFDDGAAFDATPDDDAQDAEGQPDDDDAAPDKGQTVEALKAQVEAERKRYAELRSMQDRRFNELREKMARQEGRLETLASVRNDDGASEERQKQFDAELVKAFEDGDSSKVLSMFRGMGREILEIARSEYNAKLDEFRGNVSSEFLKRDAFISRHKEEFDELTAGGMGRDQAVGFLKKIHKDEAATQPLRRPAPGSAPSGKGAGGKSAPNVGKAPESFAEAARLAGLTPKEIDQLWKEDQAERNAR